MQTERRRALGEMASGVAHDFNNLLAAILGRVHLLLMREQDVELRRSLAMIERAAADAAHTVRRIQDFIDDELSVRELIADILRSAGHVPLAAEDGPSGLDLGLPGMSGWAWRPGCARAARSSRWC